jgi:hypothetical protein
LYYLVKNSPREILNQVEDDGVLNARSK